MVRRGVTASPALMGVAEVGTAEICVAGAVVVAVVLVVDSVEVVAPLIWLLPVTTE